MSRTTFYFDPYADGTAVFLGPTEAGLMDLAWEKKSLSVKQALFYLGGDNKRAYTTVMTVLSNLASKGFLIRHKEGRSFIYEPAVSKDQFLKERVKIVTDCIQKNSGSRR